MANEFIARKGLISNGNVTVNGIISATSGNSNNWQSTYTTTNSNSANWGTGGNTYTIVNGNSAIWESTYTTVLNNSAAWVSGSNSGSGLYPKLQLSGLPLINSLYDGSITTSPSALSAIYDNDLNTDWGVLDASTSRYAYIWDLGEEIQGEMYLRFDLRRLGAAGIETRLTDGNDLASLQNGSSGNVTAGYDYTKNDSVVWSYVPKTITKQFRSRYIGFNIGANSQSQGQTKIYDFSVYGLPVSAVSAGGSGTGTSNITWPLTAQGNLDMNNYSIVNIASASIGFKDGTSFSANDINSWKSTKTLVNSNSAYWGGTGSGSGSLTNLVNIISGKEIFTGSIGAMPASINNIYDGDINTNWGELQSQNGTGNSWSMYWDLSGNYTGWFIVRGSLINSAGLDCGLNCYSYSDNATNHIDSLFSQSSHSSYISSTVAAIPFNGSGIGIYGNGPGISNGYNGYKIYNVEVWATSAISDSTLPIGSIGTSIPVVSAAKWDSSWTTVNANSGVWGTGGSGTGSTYPKINLANVNYVIGGVWQTSSPSAVSALWDGDYNMDWGLGSQYSSPVNVTYIWDLSSVYEGNIHILGVAGQSVSPVGDSRIYLRHSNDLNSLLASLPGSGAEIDENANYINGCQPSTQPIWLSDQFRARYIGFTCNTLAIDSTFRINELEVYGSRLSEVSAGGSGSSTSTNTPVRLTPLISASDYTMQSDSSNTWPTSVSSIFDNNPNTNWGELIVNNGGYFGSMVWDLSGDYTGKLIMRADQYQNQAGQAATVLVYSDTLSAITNPSYDNVMYDYYGHGNVASRSDPGTMTRTTTYTRPIYYQSDFRGRYVGIICRHIQIGGLMPTSWHKVYSFEVVGVSAVNEYTIC